MTASIELADLVDGDLIATLTLRGPTSAVSAHMTEAIEAGREAGRVVVDQLDMDEAEVGSYVLTGTLVVPDETVLCGVIRYLLQRRISINLTWVEDEQDETES